jgi:hypothetical protein
MPRRIKIDFVDFWNNWNKTDNYFFNLLSTRYQVEVSDDPDFVFYSVWGFNHLKYKCPRIFYTGESVRPDFDYCDYAFSFDFIDDPRHYRLPLYATYIDPYELERHDIDAERIADTKTKFCSFVVSSPRGKERFEFFDKLSRYKQVHSGGKYMNNIGGPIPPDYAAKLAFVKDYKFIIGYENTSYPGYTTEKILDAMRVNSLGLYWGNPLVQRDFNTRSFLNRHEFASDDDFIARIAELDNDKYKYMEYLREPYYHGNRVNEFVKPENVLKQFDYIFNDDKKPVAQDRAVQAKILMGKVKRKLRRIVTGAKP